MIEERTRYDTAKTDRLNWFLIEAPNAYSTKRNSLQEHFQVFAEGLFNVKTDDLIYKNHFGMNTSHLHLPWVNVEGSTHVHSRSRPASSSW